MTAQSRSERLLKWYPRCWRSRYGDEFAALLADEIAEQPHCWKRTIDVASTGLGARLTAAGVTKESRLSSWMPPGAPLATIFVALSAFMMFGLTVWSQLMVSWAWLPPNHAGTAAAIALMTVGAGVLAALFVVAAIPIALLSLARIVRHPTGSVIRSSSAVFLSAFVLLMGAHHFQNGWPGIGGHHWIHAGPQGDVAAFVWALTLTVTSYWAHPMHLVHFPMGELVWMAASPMALLAGLAGSIAVLKTLDMPPRIRRFELRLARIALVPVATFFLGSICWVMPGGSGANDLFHVGFIDVGCLAMMGMCIVMGERALSATRWHGPTV